MAAFRLACARRMLPSPIPAARLCTQAGGDKEVAEATTAIGRILKFGFVVSTVGLVAAYGSLIDLGATKHALVLASSHDPFFQTSGSRRLRVYANDQRKCEEVVRNGAIELLCAHLTSEDAIVRLEASNTIDAFCHGRCAQESLDHYERAMSARAGTRDAQ